MIPETIRSSATAGERLLFRTMKQVLPDDVIVYYVPEIHGRRPDFVLISPEFGMAVLEVKDYTRNTLFQSNKDEWTLLTSCGTHATVKNPALQAKEFMFYIKNVLEKDKALVHLEGKYQCGFSEKAFEKEGLPYYWLTETTESKRNYDRSAEVVTISTIDSSKGLDFRAVFIVHLDMLPFLLETDEEREASLLYIAMTRAQEYLCLTYSGESAYTRYFAGIADERKKKLLQDRLS
ncbi:nuclease-related domain-containing protein [Bhargavaea beijingensis]|uniref:nuclease-related domain-containing protein n=1 Tax=Bhargavaea beijingensis TaxID=426756 RepID=UPI002224AC1B|nr:3'-5' exonuclease [Bhargavaea beijingensis]MCW1928126.1 NERD domain-containing protein [Bhargavaea beijingensis]